MAERKRGRLIPQPFLEFIGDLGTNTQLIKAEDVDVWLERKDVYTIECMDVLDNWHELFKIIKPQN